jgi:hypothetical protein
MRRRTNWRALAAWVLLACSSSVALFLANDNHSQITNIVRKIDNRGTPCVIVKSGPQRGLPSQGCVRLARLLAATCMIEPDLCAVLIEAVQQHARRSVASPRQVAEIRRALLAPPTKIVFKQGRQIGSQHQGPQPLQTAPIPAHTPPPTPAASATSPPTPAPPSTSPEPIVAAATQTVNDTTSGLGLGRPVPNLPLPSPTVPVSVPVPITAPAPTHHTP